MSESPETIINTYKMMTSDCSNISAKIQEFNFQKDEHRLVIDTLKKLESDRKAFRLVAGVLVERTVGEVLPEISSNYESIIEVIQMQETSFKTKDAERREYKQKHGIMTQEERDAIMKANAGKAKSDGGN